MGLAEAASPLPAGAGAIAAVPQDRSWLSDIHPDFAPLVPDVNKAFERIWTFETIDEFRSHWVTGRASFPDNIPTEGFTVNYETFAASDGSDVELCIYTPDAQGSGLLPLLFVLHGGGTYVRFYMLRVIPS